MKLFLDVNIVVDLTTNREPWALDAPRLIELHQRRRIQVAIAASTLPFAYYWMRKRRIGQGKTEQILRALTSLTEVVPVDQARVLAALDDPIEDLEGAVQYELARH